MKKQPSTDDLTGDAAQVRGLLAWALENNVQLSTVTVGVCMVELRGSGPLDSERVPERAQESIYARFGGPALAHVVESEIPAGELQPVIGRTR